MAFFIPTGRRFSDSDSDGSNSSQDINKEDYITINLKDEDKCFF
jgi:hypothetical protein